jgi:tetratricopeptide (TPR) repeat protein
MSDRVRRWWARRGSGGARRFPLGVLFAFAALLVTQEVAGDLVGDIADNALFDIPLWLKALVVVVLGGIAAVLSSAVDGGDQPAPDVATNPPAVPAAPAPPPGFVGRERQLADVVELATTSQATAVVGRRAVGTSAFTLRAAQQIRDLFPDGQVYLDLRGAAAGTPLSPERALWRVMHRLGIPEPRFTRRDRVDAAVGALHAWLASRRVLFVLDNVDDPEQVRRLITDAPDCRVLLAGSVDLERLDGVPTYHLTDLPTDEAVRLLATAAHDPAVATGDTAAAARLVEVCSHQPLAIRLVGELIRDRGWTVQRATAAVEEGQRAPDAASGDTAALRPLWDACDLTYRDLPPAQRRLFRLLALVPATEIGAGTAAAVAGVTPATAAELLDGLARRGLIESARPGRYRIRQMLATSARRYLEQDSTWRVNRAGVRLARYYCTIAEEYADQLLPASGGAGATREHDRAAAQAHAWFRQEREVMFRMVTAAGAFTRHTRGGIGRPISATPWLQRLAVALCIWLAHDGRLGEWQDVCEAVKAERLGPNTRTVAFWARNELATVHRLSGNPGAAVELLKDAVKLCAGRYHRGLAQARTNQGLALMDLGDVEAAITHLDAGLTLRHRSDRHGRAVAALALGVAYLRHGDLPAARQYLVEATNQFDTLGDVRGTATALNDLGAVLWEQHDRTGAREHWAIARERFARIGDEPGAAAVLLNTAAAALAAGEGSPEEARDALVDCLRLTTTRPPTRGTGLTHLYLGDAYSGCGEPDRARDHWRQAVDILTPMSAAEAAEARRRLDTVAPHRQAG